MKFWYIAIIILSFSLLINTSIGGQTVKSLNEGRHLRERSLRYVPDGEDFVIVNGKNKFNRALYGSHTGFRLETGDVPEFAFYLPRMGGNLSLSVSNGVENLPLNNAKTIECRYRPGKRIYTISDPFFRNGTIKIEAMALFDDDGAIWKITTENIPSNHTLNAIFGGASNTRFSRDGDLGVDPPDCFELKKEYCIGNQYELKQNTFVLSFGQNNEEKLSGIFPVQSKLQLDDRPALHASFIPKKEQYLYIGRKMLTQQTNLKEIFDKTEEQRAKISSQISISTPDPYFNTIGGALSMAADAIWDGQVWLHGAVGWRMPLTGWRGAYAGDFLGWHDRAVSHFDAYAASQVTNVPPTIPHPAQDSTLNLARAAKIWGTPMYSNGYICRNPYRNNEMHHYDMNLCYIDELLWHFCWTGDLNYAKKMWPVLVRHLAWEKLNYDPDDDGLYDAYACIWASDALYYNSGAVTHSSAYNYRANKIAASIALKIGENPDPYLKEAEKIDNAINSVLWIPSKGHWAEYKDLMGLKRLHEDAALWTIYHAIDNEIGDAFQQYQATQYIDNDIPHIPVKAAGLADENYFTLSTTNWHPYAWSINNVAFAEVMHTALAYFQTNRNEEAFHLLKSSILDGMYLGESPRNFGQISFYDAARGESYRDFADPIGVASRVFVQGLFGIYPDALNRKLTIKPGFPKVWNHASIQTPDISFGFEREADGFTDSYTINNHISNVDSLSLQIGALTDEIESVVLDGKSVGWNIIETSIGKPMIDVRVSIAKDVLHKIVVKWRSNKLNMPKPQVQTYQISDKITICPQHEIVEYFDPQMILHNVEIDNSRTLTGTLAGKTGFHSFFVKLRSGTMSWWQPVNIHIEKSESEKRMQFSDVDSAKCEPIAMQQYFNANVTDIFKNKYLSPRSPFTTLQIPWQGIGDWCHPLMSPEIDDIGMRKLIHNDRLITSLHIPFSTPKNGRNIAFTSLWDNYPDSIQIKLQGKATHAYLLMAGTTNHMQSHIENGSIEFHYQDGTVDTLTLINPDNWCPIEQDYFEDGMAFQLSHPRPYRLHFKTGLISNNLTKDLNIQGVDGRLIEGGAGILLDEPLNPDKELNYMKLRTLSNDVIIGLMAITLQRE
jgi:hypothetical protein